MHRVFIVIGLIAGMAILALIFASPSDGGGTKTRDYCFSEDAGWRDEPGACD